MSKDFNTEYREFIQKVQLSDIALVKSSHERHVELEQKDLPVQLNMKMSTRMSEVLKDGHISFDLMFEFKVEGYKSRLLFTLDALYRLRYEIGDTPPPSDEVLKAFKSQNVTMNAYPFLRELIHRATSNAGFMPIMIPLLKASSGSGAPDRSVTPPKKASKPRRKS